MPRIAYISSTFPDYQKCGVGSYAGYLTQALAQQGHQVHVVTTAIPEIRPTLGKVHVHKIMESWNPLDAPKLFKLFHEIKPDLIHINHPTAIASQKSKFLVNMIPEMNRATWRLPLVTTLHEFTRVSLLGRLKLMPFLLQSDAITVTNQRYKEAVSKFTKGQRDDKVHVINIGSQFNANLAPASRVEQRQKWDLADDDKVLGFMGFITPPKGFHHLIEAAAPLLRADPKLKILALSSWNLSTPLYRQTILDRIQAENITGQVIFTGFLEDADLWNGLSAIDLCVFPFDAPVEERSSGPLRQTLFRGLPTIVYSESRDYAEFGFKHGKNIWFTPLKNTEQLRRDIINLLEDKNLAAEIATGTQALRPSFSFDQISNEFSRLYAQLLK